MLLYSKSSKKALLWALFYETESKIWAGLASLYFPVLCHSASMSVELIAFGLSLSKFLYAKTPFLASKGKETPSIKHIWC
jgi:hypothetical protein